MSVHTIDRYEIVAELGRGGMGAVYRAHDPRFKREVALKVLPREFLHHPTFRARFEREGQVVAGLEHPAIVPVYDIGEHDGQPFMVMRLMSGGSLTDRIVQGPLSLDETARIVTAIASALDEVHRRGIIHRDLKPGNILFDRRGLPYLSDFGIVRMAEATNQLTGSGGVIGTPSYMAPELSTEGGTSSLVDIYALAVTMFEMLTGSAPYQAETPIGIMLAHISEPIPDIRSDELGLSDDLQRIIETGMAKEPTSRYQTASDLASDLQAVAQGKPPAIALTGPQPRDQTIVEEATTLPVMEAGITTRDSDTVSTLPALVGLSATMPDESVELPAKSAKFPVGWAAGAILALALVGSAALFVMNQGAQPEATPDPTSTSTRESANVLPTQPAEPTDPPTTQPTHLPIRTEEPTPTTTPTPTPEAVVITADNVVDLAAAQTIEIDTGGFEASTPNVVLSSDGSRAGIVLTSQQTFSTDGGAAILIDLLTGQQARSELGIFSMLAWPESGPIVAVSVQQGLVVHLDPDSAEQVNSVSGNWGFGRQLSEDGSRLVAWSSETTPNSLSVVNTATGEIVSSIPLAQDKSLSYSGGYLCADLSRVGIALTPASSGDVPRSQLILLNADSGAVVNSISLAEFGDFRTFAINANGSMFVAAPTGEAILILWNTQSGQLITSDAGIFFGEQDLAFSPDGSLLASASLDGRVIIWDAATAEPIRILEEHSGPVTSVAFSRDGKVLASLSSDRQLIIWQVTAD